MFYTAKTPGWVKKLFTGSIWEMATSKKVMYLTFDDGPHPAITSWVLDELNKYNAKASFFCLGKNVQANPNIYSRILAEGHAVGNHSYDHPDGWKTGNAKYLQNVLEARNLIDSNLFRPPYGRITRNQHRILTTLKDPFKIVMWSVLSGDFDIGLSPQRCLKLVMKNAGAGSVIVFHDSEKANERMRYALPILLKHFSEKGFRFEKIDLENRA